MNIDCDICKFNDNCEPRSKELWTDPKSTDEGRYILGCNEGEPDKLKIKEKIKYLKKYLNKKIRRRRNE